MQRVTHRLLLILALLQCSINVFSQLTAPGRDWAGVTQYVYSIQHQDSIFTFFASSGNLNSKHTTGRSATFAWYKYNSTIPNVSNRFELINTETGVTSSSMIGLVEGGYRVIVTNDLDSTEIFTAWLFTDNIVLSRVDSDNRCDFLELVAITSPSSYNIQYDRFYYHDLSKPSQPEMNTYGKGYFKEVVWEASDSRIEFTQSSSLRQTIADPAPLYNSSYDVSIKNVFGRVLTYHTDEFTAIATKAVQKIQVENDGGWTDYSSGESYEALLGLRLESSSINADSIFWILSNLKTVNYEDEYVVIWKDSSLFANRVEAFPTKDLMRPGYFKVKHLAYNSSSGCKDSVEIAVEVDSSKIKADAIPNVFSPNGDNLNKTFKFIDPEENLKSISSFSIRILSRSGRLIYKYSGDPREWEGWNGKIDGTGADAAPGVYFFIIEARGWDGKEFDYGPYKGFLHLYR